MCGIVGYVGERDAYPILIKGLYRLEYRGYDSAGVALVSGDGRLNVFKCKGKVADLEHFTTGKDVAGHIGIAHTRWATHGVPNDANAHPHYSETGNIALIHNGIIENYSVLKQALVENGYTFHNARSHEGLMRNMIVRTASTGEVMVIVVFNSDDRPRITALMDHLAAKFPEITSLFYIVNTKFNDSVGDLDPVCYRGKDHIIEEMEGLRFKVGPKSFYQTNSAQAYELYKVARDFADLRPGDVLYDLYTGTGTIANFCAARCARVVGVEYVPEAIADAKVNSELNGIENTVFYAGDMKAVLDDGFVAANGRPDVIILDPPRAGVDEPVIEVILRAAPERIVYVSCNPATQARDLQLMDAAYRVEAVQPVDMFPHTHHVENVVKLVRR